MLTKIRIDGFKSFQKFEMEFSPLTIIAGANASGKSNLFDALQLISRLAETELRTAFGEQRGSASELFTQYDEELASNNMSFELEMLVSQKIKDNWGGEATLKYTRLKYKLEIQRRKNARGFEDLFVANEFLENLKHEEDQWVKNHISKDLLNYWRPKVITGKRGKPYIYTENKNGIATIKVPQDGKPGVGKETPAEAISQTILSGINSVDLPHAFAAKEEMRSWKFLQLNPEDLRQPTRQEPNASDRISSSGKNLAAALYRIKQDDEYSLTEISRKLNSFLPNFTDVLVEDDKANKQFLIKIRGEDGREFSSRVLSEGTLRLLSLCIMLYDDQHQSLLCFEEPENGIHPFRIKATVLLLKELSTDFSDSTIPLRQVLVNTHSPVLVNETLSFSADRNVAVWLSQSRTLIKDVNGKKFKIKVTKALPVQIVQERQLSITFSEQERKLTLTSVKEYLETSDFENTLNSLMNND
jgi:predicted ATPase